jgi:hypothetical protein
MTTSSPRYLTHLVDLLYQRVKISRVDVVPGIPPLLQYGTLLQLIVEDAFCLAQKITKVGDADVQQRVRPGPLAIDRSYTATGASKFVQGDAESTSNCPEQNHVSSRDSGSRRSAGRQARG